MITQPGLFLAAIATLLLSHLLRAIRLSPLYPRKFGVRRFDLLMGLAVSYAIGIILPFRLGEIGRVVYVGKRRDVRYSYVAATVFAERIADVLCVGLISLALIAGSVVSAGQLGHLAVALLMIGIGSITLAFAIRDSTRARHVIWLVASIFRNKLCYAILDFFWSFSELVTGGILGRQRFLVLTPVVWFCYLFSYHLFGRATQLKLADIVYFLLQSPSHTIATLRGSALRAQELPLLLFLLTPILLIFAYGFLSERPGIVAVFHSIFAGRYFGTMAYVAAVSDRFSNLAEYESFLLARFTTRSDILTDFSMQAILDGKVQRLFPGGSDAITALVELENKLVIRKFALGDAGKKLQTQARWLQAHHDDLPLVDVVGEHSGSGFYSYDMPFFSTASDFYDVIHTASVAQSEQILGSVIDQIAGLHERTAAGPATQEIVSQYLSQKASRNAQAVLAQSREWLRDGSSRYQLNGGEYDLADWQYLLDPKWLRRQISDLRTASIHGDLTIENIIVNTAEMRGMYIIDPNPENIFDTPLIDWAKLMQSLHLGYEGLNKVPTCKWTNGSFQMALTRSHAYSELFHFTRGKLADRFGQGILREVTFHELINYLRLTPYKLRHAPQKGLTFFACTSMLLREYLEQYG